MTGRVKIRAGHEPKPVAVEKLLASLEQPAVDLKDWASDQDAQPPRLPRLSGEEAQRLPKNVRRAYRRLHSRLSEMWGAINAVEFAAEDLEDEVSEALDARSLPNYIPPRS